MTYIKNISKIQMGREISTKRWVLYILKSYNGRQTYVGITNQLDRRIRQHNGYIKGGAKKTRSNRPWRIMAFVEGFNSFSEAGSFEWINHHLKGRKTGLMGRFHNLYTIMTLPHLVKRFVPSTVTTLYLLGISEMIIKKGYEKCFTLTKVCPP